MMDKGTLVYIWFYKNKEFLSAKHVFHVHFKKSSVLLQKQDKMNELPQDELACF